MRRQLVCATALIAVAAVILATVARPASASAAGRPLHNPRSHSLLIIGASYSAGWGASSPRLDYARCLADELGWPTTVSADPGAGYISRGNDGRGSFLEQVRSLPSTLRPGLVIIQGGRDDIGEPDAQEAAAVMRTLAAVRARFGDPQIVMLGDIPASMPVGGRAVAMNDLLGRVASIEHVVFIDPIREHWITCTNAGAFRSAVPGHPNDAGHAYIARRLLLDLGAWSGDAIHEQQS